MLSTGQVHQLWLLAIDGEDPLFIHASAAEGDAAWLDVARDAVFTDDVELGPDAPPAAGG